MTDKADDVTQDDTKRADDWAYMLGRMGGVIIDGSQRKGLALQFAAHREEAEKRARPAPDGLREAFLKGWDACWTRKADAPFERDGGRQTAWEKYLAALSANEGAGA